MSSFKSKKTKKMILSLGIATLLAIPLGVFVYSLNHRNHLGINYINNNQSNPEIFNRGFANSSNASISNSDHNLKELKTPIVTEDKIEERIQPIEVDKSNHETKPIENANNNGNLDSDNIEIKEVVINGVKVILHAEKPPKRILDKRDIDSRITNRIPYINNHVGKVLRIEVTEKLKEATVKNLVNGEWSSLENYTNTFLSDDIPLTKTKEFDPDLYFRNNSHVWQRMIDRFWRLLESENVVNFLNEDAAKKWRDKENLHFDSKDLKYAWLIKNLDYSKFTKLSKGALEYLGQGYTASADNVYVDENGELSSYAFSPAPGYNSVTTRQEKDNRERRAFAIDGYYGRNSGDIASGDYPGWTKRIVTNDEKFKEFNVGNNDGIVITELTREKQDPGLAINKGYVVEIDAANEAGFEKTEKLIRDLQSKNIEITSYRIRNMGKKDINQSFRRIFKALPNKLPQLELFFDDRATNTEALIELENKEIKELSIFTIGNALLDNWSINPLALRGVAWVNTIDYNINLDSKKFDMASRIVFNTLAFEESDIKKEQSDPKEKFKRINEGLRMAYYVRNNEGVFQGNFGPGLDPDTDEGNNSYPTRIDFSRAPSIKSLKHLVFSDYIKESNRSRKLKNVKFFNDKQWFEISADDLDNAQFDSVIAHDEPGPPKAKIEFSNVLETQSIRISGNSELSSSALSNLRILLKLTEIGNPIQVDSNAIALKNQLTKYGFNVEDSSDETFN
ncbi:putative immunoglobulin-blocking virulence protein [Metamycoplasma auris]|uniref:Putative immunoglobulin-blocking virulence protein n=1 Tax=Metamycoplasma auris TaxID=51363 RepID=A0A2W7G957_9BACT|nr:putative immunoglobulin-blocking virulence protein [Metamycoplasma auris]PZW01585.1 putative immunoglobulin-blocking virulence protein [Metamycoplasma auris]